MKLNIFLTVIFVNTGIIGAVLACYVCAELENSPAPNSLQKQKYCSLFFSAALYSHIVTRGTPE
jgi:hypothetical protein